MRSAAHGVDGREILLQQFVAGNRLDLRTMCIGQRARGVFQLLRAHVFGRGVDPVAHAQAGGDQVGHLAGWRRYQLGRRAVALAVAVEAVAAQAPAQLQQRQFGGR